MACDRLVGFGGQAGQAADASARTSSSGSVRAMSPSTAGRRAASPRRAGRALRRPRAPARAAPRPRRDRGRRPPPRARPGRRASSGVGDELLENTHASVCRLATCLMTRRAPRSLEAIRNARAALSTRTNHWSATRPRCQRHDPSDPPSLDALRSNSRVSDARAFAQRQGRGIPEDPHRIVRMPDAPRTASPLVVPERLLDEQHLAIGRQRPDARAASAPRSRRPSRAAWPSPAPPCRACTSRASRPTRRRARAAAASASVCALNWSTSLRVGRRAASCPARSCRRPPSRPPRSARSASGTRAPPAGCSGWPSAPSAGPRC